MVARVVYPVLVPIEPEEEARRARSEGRPSKPPTIDQVLRLFEDQNKHALYDGDRLIKQFADPLTPVQSQILQLLSMSATYGPRK
jgi:hypothetical protein